VFPERSEPLYQEPNGTVKAGRIVSFVVVGVLFAFFGLFFWDRFIRLGQNMYPPGLYSRDVNVTGRLKVTLSPRAH
jgi:hypothetical protein